MRSIHDAISFKRSLDASTYLNTQNGQSVDTLGFNDGELVVSVEALSNENSNEHYTVALQESSDGSTGWVDANDTDGNAIEIVPTLGAGSSDSFAVKTARIGELGKHERYLRARIEMEGTNPSATVSGVIALGRAFQEPV